MRAALVFGEYEVKVVDKPKPEIDDENDVLIKVKACGVCPFDLRIYSGTFKAPYPIPVGHEVAGVVEEVGSAVKGIKPGDKVAVDAMLRCGVCGPCRRGYDNLCENKGSLPNGFAEYIKFPAPYVHPVRNDVRLEELALSEPLACCLNALGKVGDLRAGDTLHVVGAGPIGLMFAKLGKIMGLRVIISEVIDHRLEIAKRTSDLALNPLENDLKEEVRSFTDGYGANVTVLTATNQETLDIALDTTGKGGYIVLFAAKYPKGKVSLDPNIIHYKEICLVGAEGRRMADFTTAVRLIDEKLIDLSDVISHVFPLEKIEEAFNTAMKREGLKVVVSC